MEIFDHGNEDSQLDAASRNMWEEIQDLQARQAGKRGINRVDFLDLSPWEREIEITDEWQSRRDESDLAAHRSAFWKDMGKTVLVSIGRTYTMFSPYGIVGAYFQQRRDR